MGTQGLTRRGLLRLTGQTAGGLAVLNSPLGMLLEAITRTQIGRALAAEAEIAPRKWVDMRFDGAPPRWVYDLFLAPYEGASYVANPYVGTRYGASGDRYVDVEYATYKSKGLNLPWLWQFPVPRTDGKTRPMTDLLDHALAIRGINVGNPAHGGAMGVHYRPLGSMQTLPALAADRSAAPIPAVYYAVGGFQFGSLASKSAVQLTGANLLSTLMAPFSSRSNPNLKAGEAALKDYLRAVNESLAADAKARNPGTLTAELAQKSALELLATAFGDIDAQWEALLDKYTKLIARAIDVSTSMPGLTDKPIGATGTRSEKYVVNRVICTNPDMRTMIGATAANAEMAKSFALAEFVLKSNLSDSLSFGMGTIAGIDVNDAKQNHAPDEHGTGSMGSLLINSMWARAHAACMLELIDQLKAAGIWREVVINVSGEFNRTPRATGEGSDHLSNGGSAMLYSGALQGVSVIGNIQADSGNRIYPGTIGAAAGVSTLGGMELDVASVAASMATMLRVPSPVTARASFLEETADGIVSKIEPAKNV